MNLHRAAARGVLWAAIGNWGYQITTLIVFSVLARLLRPEDFGLVALAAVFTALMRILAQQGLVDAIVQRPEVEDEDLDTTFWASLALGILFTALIAAGSGTIGQVLGQPALAPVIAYLSLGLLISSLGSVPRAVLARRLEFRSLSLRLLISVVVGGGAGVAAALSGMGVWSLVVQSVVTELTAVFALWVFSQWRPRFRFSWARLHRLLAFGIHVVGFRVLLFFRTRSDNLLVGSFLGTAALGFYSVAYRLLQLMTNATTAVVGVVAFPVFSRIQGEQELIRAAYYKAIRLTSLVSFPAFVGMAVLAPELTRLAFGDNWGPSVPVMRVLALTGLLQSVTFVNGVVMKAMGKPSWRLGIVALEAVASLVGFAIAVRWGIVAVAASLGIVSYALAPVSLFATNKLIGLRARRCVRSILAPVGASIWMAALLLVARLVVPDLGLFWRTIFLVATGVMSYACYVWLFARPVMREAIESSALALRSRKGSGRRHGTSPPQK